MHRRTVLQSLGACLAGAGTSMLSASRSVRKAFGAAPPTIASVPEDARVGSVLEIFLCGGVSQYESFYCVPEHGRADDTHWHLFEQSAALEQALQACAITEPALEPFAEDDLGQLVHLGPFAMPLRRRSDLIQRLRICVTRHDLAPHEAAIPLALSGRTLGNPAVAGLGAHVQRYFSETGGEPAGPLAFVLLSSSLNSVFIDNLRALTATGLHPPQARPLGLQVDGAEQFTTQLQRPGVGEQRAAVDSLLATYLDEYARQLTWPASGDLLRAPRFADFRAATAAMSNATALSESLGATWFAGRSGASCGEEVPVDSVSMQLDLAAHLLTHPSQPARYVCVVDGGFVPNSNGGGAYDSHSDNIWIQSRNLTHTLQCLVDNIRRPDEDAPHKIDLDRTLIVFTTEFGRTPYAEGESGRNHWPYGYAQALLGGPIQSPAVSGGCAPDARALNADAPQHSRIAALLALGIWPFSPEGFSVADVPGVTNEEAAAAQVLSTQLGIG